MLVARLGSVKAAAQALGVSEPAVSGALAALRQHLGDPLVSRSAVGMTLTAGGQRLVGIASQMINLAADAEAAVRQANGAPEPLRVAATSTVAEFVAPPLLEAFTARSPLFEASVGVAGATEMAALLMERLADVCLGPRLAGDGAADLESEPMMRYRLVVVAGSGHRLNGIADVGWNQLAAQEWFVDPSGTDPSTEVGMLLARLRVPEARIRVFPNQAAVMSATIDGHGVAPAIAHLVTRDLRRGSLVRIDAVSTPLDLLWYVNTLRSSRRSRGAGALRRFLVTPEAMQAMHRADGGVPASRFRPPVYVTIWS